MPRTSKNKNTLIKITTHIKQTTISSIHGNREVLTNGWGYWDIYHREKRDIKKEKNI